MESRRAEDLMIPLEKFPHVSDTCTIHEAIHAMMKYQIKSLDGRMSVPRVLLVFDAVDVLVGMVRRRDIMRAIVPSYLLSAKSDLQQKFFDIQVDPNLAELTYDKLVKGIQMRAEKHLPEVMIPVTAVVNHDDHLTKVINEMVDYNVSILPVIKESKVVGVVRSVDVLNELAILLHLGLDQGKEDE